MKVSIKTVLLHDVYTKHPDIRNHQIHEMESIVSCSLWTMDKCYYHATLLSLVFLMHTLRNKLHYSKTVETPYKFPLGREL
jgi:hypothetical protein